LQRAPLILKEYSVRKIFSSIISIKKNFFCKAVPYHKLDTSYVYFFMLFEISYEIMSISYQETWSLDFSNTLPLEILWIFFDAPPCSMAWRNELSKSCKGKFVQIFQNPKIVKMKQKLNNQQQLEWTRQNWKIREINKKWKLCKASKKYKIPKSL